MKNYRIIKMAIMQFNRALISALFLIRFFCPAGTVYAQENTPLVIVTSRSAAPYNNVVMSFKKTLLGRQGNIDIVELNFEDKKTAENLNSSIETIKPVLILTLGTPATRAVRQMFGSLTVVYTMILNPEKSNVSPPGISIDIPFELKLSEFKRIFPTVKRIGTIYSPEYNFIFEEALRACNRLGLRLIGKEIASQNEFPSALEEIINETDCFLMLADPNVYLPKTTEQLLIRGIQRKIPVIGLSASYAKAGAVIAFDCDYEDLGRQAAELFLRMLAGEDRRIRETVAVPRKITYSLNLLVAKRIGTELSPKVIKNAGEVFGR